MFDEIEKILEEINPEQNKFDIFDKPEIDDIDNLKQEKRISDTRYGNVQRISLFNLMFSKKFRFIVPLYQRSYVWNQRNIKSFTKLLDDSIKSVNYGERNVDAKETISFFGFIILKNEIGNMSNEFSIIDGQQRITTSYLLLIVIRDFFMNFGFSKNTPESQELVKIGGLINDRALFAVGQKKALKLKHAKDFTGLLFSKLIDHDDSLFDSKTGNILSETSISRNESLIGVASHALYKNYNSLMNWVKSYLTFDASDNKHKGKLVKNIKSLLKALNTITPYINFTGLVDTEQKLFESLNATSVKLTDIDLVRNYLYMFHKIESHEELFRKYWHNFEANLKFDSSVMENYFYYFAADFTHEFISGKNNEIFHNFREKLDDKIEKELKELDRDQISNYIELSVIRRMTVFSKIYSSLFITKPTEKLFLTNKSDYKLEVTKSFINFKLFEKEKLDEHGSINFYGNKTISPLLLRLTWYWHEEFISDRVFLSAIKIVESYFIRRKAYGLPDNVISRMPQKLFNEFAAKKMMDLESDLIDFLWDFLFIRKEDIETVDGEKRKRKVKRTKQLAPVYSNKNLFEIEDGQNYRSVIYQNNFYTNPNLAKIFLLGEIYDNLSQETYIRAFNLDDSFDTKFSMEHFMPQNVKRFLAENQSENPTEEEVENLKNIHRANIHTIGNLFIITGELNSKLSDFSLMQKQEVLENEVTLGKQSRNIYGDIFNYKTDKDFGIKQIQHRSKLIVDGFLDNLFPDEIDDLLDKVPKIK